MKDNVVITNLPLTVVRPEVGGDVLALWRQLKQALRDLALTQLQPSDRLPTEDELCRRYGVSRTTVRQAIASLIAEGILYRRQGSGTYVAPRKIEEHFAPTVFTHLSGRDLESEAEIKYQLLSAEEITPDHRLIRRLSTTEGERVFKIRRLRLLDGEPMASEITYLPSRYCPDLLSIDLAAGSLRRLLESRYGIRLARIDATIEIVTADEYRAQLLRVAVTSPLLLIERTTLSAAGVPVIFSRQFLRSDRCRIAVSSNVATQ